MGTTAPEVPAPVTAAEEKVEAAAPDAAKPAVDLAEAEFNAVVATDAEKGKEAAAAIDAHDPAIALAADDARKGDVTGVVSNFAGVEKEVKAGYKTTEFWLVLIGVILTQLGALKLPGKYGDTITTSALLGSYAVSRGLAKKG